MIIKPISRVIQEPDATSFTVIGSPGSDGFGPEAMQVFAAAVAESEGDFIVALGDIAPQGRESFYKYIAGLIDRHSKKPMHVVAGSHDTGAGFEAYFGLPNRAILSSHFTLIMLDNSRGGFTDDALDFLRQTLAVVDSRNIVVAFHLPPPNRFAGDSMSVAEWTRFEDAVGVWRKRISLLVCGHDNGYFEDEIDGLQLIVTGGGGARLVTLERIAPPLHHVVEFSVSEDGRIVGRRQTLRPGGYSGRLAEIDRYLAEALAEECRAHVDQLLQAEEAERRGFVNLARLFRTTAESRLRHARNIRLVQKKTEDPRVAVSAMLEESGGEGEEERGDTIAAADMAHDAIAAHALRSVAASECVHLGLFAKAVEATEGDLDIEETAYHLCGSCGLIIPGYDLPGHCPECGAPADMIHEVK